MKQESGKEKLLKEEIFKAKFLCPVKMEFEKTQSKSADIYLPAGNLLFETDGIHCNDGRIPAAQ